ncbi:hypothetical protein [Mycobacterium sp.]|uniref:hypothetical protein n=1 Tax=Mycobacterium sp. TaxID=1785 RepID=UPI0031D72DB0
MTTTTAAALASLDTCRDRLSGAALDAAHAATLLDGARKARARELVDLLDIAISHATRLATVVEGDARAQQRT